MNKHEAGIAVNRSKPQTGVVGGWKWFPNVSRWGTDLPPAASPASADPAFERRLHWRAGIRATKPAGVRTTALALNFRHALIG